MARFVLLPVGWPFAFAEGAAGCLAAAEKGRTGECYILSNRHYEIKDVLRIVKKVQGI